MTSVMNISLIRPGDLALPGILAGSFASSWEWAVSEGLMSAVLGAEGCG